MIPYSSGSFGFQILFRLHGSAVFKALAPALFSSCMYAILLRLTHLDNDDGLIVDHPYAIGALISALTLLLAFRANFSYNRWWESVSAVYLMQSKWADVAIELAAFHLQSDRYSKPPAFGAHPELTCLVERHRERNNIMTLEDLDKALEHQEGLDKKKTGRFRTFLQWKNPARQKSGSGDTSEATNVGAVATTNTAALTMKTTPRVNSINAPKGNRNIVGMLRLPYMKNPAPLVRGESAMLKVDNEDEVRIWDSDRPPLFLQEAAHLLSLLSAVALSTLRNDKEDADSPLKMFVPGAPWPHVDPDDYGADIRKNWDTTKLRAYAIGRYLCGMSRTPKMLTLYNVARPFRVIGGVSDAEIEVLQAARGPLAKVALVFLWVQEFITREHLAGSTGEVAPPIISRLYHLLSDGMLGYNQARKVAYVPFPFPHAQITALFVVIVSAIMPLLMLSYLDHKVFGFFMNLLTVLCFGGLHEVARELEKPFQNVPNDLPLNNLQAQYNEALITIFLGSHPDAYWEVVQSREKEKSDKHPFDVIERGPENNATIPEEDLVINELPVDAD